MKPTTTCSLILALWLSFSLLHVCTRSNFNRRQVADLSLLSAPEAELALSICAGGTRTALAPLVACQPPHSLTVAHALATTHGRKVAQPRTNPYLEASHPHRASQAAAQDLLRHAPADGAHVALQEPSRGGRAGEGTECVEDVRDVGLGCRGFEGMHGSS